QALGLATTVSGTNPNTNQTFSDTFYSAQSSVPYVTVSPIVAQSGTINIDGDIVSGGGSLDAPGNVTVTLINNSPAYLRLQGIDIPDNVGGRVQWNGVNITSDSELGGFTGALSVSADTAQPQIIIQNNYNADDPQNASATFTTPDVEIDGDINNVGGSLSISAQGNVVVAGSFDVGTLNIKTGANFVLNAPPSQFNVGGDPAGANSPWEALASAAAANQKNLTDANISSLPNGQSLLNAAVNATTSASNVIAANNIVIS